MSRQLQRVIWLGLFAVGCSTATPPKTCTDFCGDGAACVDGQCVPVNTPTCSDFCGAGAACVSGQCTPLKCEPACGAGMACENGSCRAVPAITCSPACGPCDTCDSTGTTPTCVNMCGAGTTCNASTRRCEPLRCDPACGAGTACQNGQCVPVPAVACSPACGPCQTCNTMGASPVCVDTCGPGSACDSARNVCISTAEFHANAPQLKGPFASGYAVTAACVGCHQQAAAEFMSTIHWTWNGPAEQLYKIGNPTERFDGGVGKTVLINNFCVATASNDKRCDQCHAGYGGDPVALRPQKSARLYRFFDATDAGTDSSIPLANRIDCLVCHSDPTAGYAKDPKNFGNPATTSNLAVSAQMIIKPTRTNCGACHFFAGGGDNVKLMGSSLKNPSTAIDVHMGKGMDCADCHATAGHGFKGAGVHVPANHGRVSCEDCHGAAPHTGRVQSNGEQLDSHTARIACQTCHIPRYSRGQFAKTNWDWSTAGNNTRGVAGVITTKVNDLGQPDSAGTAVTTYDYIKGDFTWQRNVMPAYAWNNGKSVHMTTMDRLDLAQKGLTNNDADRIDMGSPLGSRADANAKIAPYKLMRGKQGVYIDGANSYVIAPNVFGPGSLWGVLQAPGYAFTDQAAMDTTWSAAFSRGAIAAGQAASGTTLQKFNGTTGWDWRTTKLSMDLNHEVAPKAQALGANGACGDCHGAAPKLPLCELYANVTPKPWGVTCP